MCSTISTEFIYMENWLLMLLSTYKKNPSSGLAKTISFYLSKILTHDDIYFCGDKRCQYLAMHRFWQWQAINAATGMR